MPLPVAPSCATGRIRFGEAGGFSATREAKAMSDFWMIGLSGAALYLRANGFSWSESDRLLRLKLRHERGEFRELTDENKRLEFAHWLVQHGWLTDRLDGPAWDCGQERPAA